MRAMTRCFDILRDFRWVPVGLCVLLVALLLRPHGDTFTALDHSGYRLMAYAFTQGRGFHEPDLMLFDVPPEARRGLMLLPHMHERNTRDRSFLVHSLDDPQTEPFFYPLLPLLAAGLDTLLPGIGMDLTVPIAGVVSCALLLWIGWQFGGIWGSVVAFVLCVGSPLPLWLFRGFYVEAIGAVCLVGAVALWYRESSFKGWELLAGLLAGLAVSFHPVYIVISLPLVALMVLGSNTKMRGSFLMLAAFGVGFGVLLVMTEWICSPYGTFSFRSMLFTFRASASHRLPILFSLGSGILMVTGVLLRPWWRPYACKYACSQLLRLALLGLALLPFVYAALMWRDKGLVRVGMLEAWGGVRLPFGLLLGSGLLGTSFWRKSTKAFWLLLLFLATVPVFFYLKGAEQMGMWSQRRLLPAYMLLVLTVLPFLAVAVQTVANRFTEVRLQVAAKGAVIAILLFVGGANLARWPAPYLVRVDAGALAFVEQIKSEIGDRLTMFDYQPFSFPFAVDNRTRVIGIGQYDRRRLAPVAQWLAEKAREDEVLWTTAFRNPGMEDGVLFETLSVHTGAFARVASRGLLPAERRQHDIRIELMRAVPVLVPVAGMAVDKVLDGGPLALREPWGHYRRTLRTDDGQVLPVEWSRDGSGIVGPVPPPGGMVMFEIWATSGQDIPQLVEIVCPWKQQADLQVESAFSHYSLQIVRDADCDWEGATGVYRLNIPTPYNPGAVGIRGFTSDLGVLVHRIRVETAEYAKEMKED
jgi:hypothetical protein